jgi:uncharacterized membrane protein
MEEKQVKKETAVVRVGITNQVIGIVAVLAGIVVWVFIKNDNDYGLLLIVFGLVGLIMGRYIASHPKKYVHDERSIRIREKAGYYTFVVTFFTPGIILILEKVKLTPLLTPSKGFLFGVTFMFILIMISFSIFHFYYSRKEV